jgi:hypothetical protein
MPLFGSGTPPAPLDPRLAQHLPVGDRHLRKSLQREASTIVDALGPAEQVTFICYSESAFATSVRYDAVVVATTDRVMVVRKGRVESHARGDILGIGWKWEQESGMFFCAINARQGAVNVHISDEDRARAFVTCLGGTP